jgi:N-dimethylarginine dimethylaminohydrolase
MTSTAAVLMCPPDHYAIQYEINPWMSRSRPCDHKLAVQQWEGLHRLLEQLGVKVFCLTPVAELPDMVFTANAALVLGQTAILSHFRYHQRQGEEPHYERWLSEHGFQARRLRSSAFFEGAGDALFCGDTLFAGYRTRSDVRASKEIGDLLGCRVIPLELVCSHFYHLDTCFCPLRSDMAIYYPGAFDDYGRRALQSSIGRLIAVEDEEARQFACNAVVVGRTVIANSGCRRLSRRLHSFGFAFYETPLSEFVKSGGSAKCLTLRLDGEEAATWRRDEPAVATFSV